MSVPLTIPEGLVESLAAMPVVEILALRPTPAMHERLKELLESNRTRGLSQAEGSEWEKYEEIEHLVRMAKIIAHRSWMTGV